MSTKKYKLIKRFSAWVFVAVVLVAPLIGLTSTSNNVHAASPTFAYGTLYYVADPNTGDLDICNNKDGINGVNASGTTICWYGTSSDSTPDNLGNSMFGFNDGGGQGGVSNTDANIVVNACSTDASAGTATNVDGSGSVSVTVNNFNEAQSSSNFSSTVIICSANTPPPTGAEPASDQVINVNITYNGLDDATVTGGGNDTLGPVTLTLCSSTDTKCANPIQSIQSNATTLSSSTTVLNGAFTGVAPGNYVICTSNIASNPCQNKTKVKDQILTVDFLGTATDAADIIGDSQSGDTSPSCESSGFSLSWIMCPFIDGMAKATDGIYADLVQPLLKTPPIVINQPADCTTNPPPTTLPAGCDQSRTYQVWSDFRTYGNIFLVLALLGLVFSEIIGGGIIQAYTAKKMLPRILLAVILINLSIYIVAALLDITNVLGAGLSSLITAPFSSAGAFYIHLNGATSGIGLTGFVAAGALGIWAAVGPGTVLIIMFLFSVLIPALFAMLAVLFTVVIRQAIIVLLVLSSPVAFALYVLPNTEQYFKKWWHLLFTTLLVYPIIAVLFSLGNVLSVTLSGTSYRQDGVSATLSGLVAMVAIIMPLFLIPFAFKISGGLIGSIYGAASSLGKKAASGIAGDPRDEHSLQNNLRRRAKTIADTRGDKLTGWLRKKTMDGPGGYDTDKWLGRRAHGLATQAHTRLTNYQRRVAGNNKAEGESILGDLNTGADTWGRALFAIKQKEDVEYTDAHGETRTLKKGHYYSHAVNSDGKYTEFAAGDVLKAQGFVKGNPSRFQALAQYEISKVANDKEFYGVDKNGDTIYDPSRVNELDRSRMPGGSFMSNYLEVARDANLGAGPAQGATVGAFYSSQAQRRELKATKLKADFSGFERDNDGFVQDMGENVGLYATSNSKPSVIYSMLDYYKVLEQKRQNGEKLTPVEKRSYKILQGVGGTLNETLSHSPSDSIPTGANVAEVGEDGPRARGGGTGAAVNVNNAMKDFVRFSNNIRGVNIDNDGPGGSGPIPLPPAPSSPRGPSSGPRQPSSGSGSHQQSDGTILIGHEEPEFVSPRPSINPPTIADNDRAPESVPPNTPAPTTRPSSGSARRTPNSETSAVPPTSSTTYPEMLMSPPITSSYPERPPSPFPTTPPGSPLPPSDESETSAVPPTSSTTYPEMLMSPPITSSYPERPPSPFPTTPPGSPLPPSDEDPDEDKN